MRAPFRLALAAAFALSASAGAAEQTMTLTVSGAGGDASFEALGGTVLIARDDSPCPAASATPEPVVNHFDLAFDPALMADRSFLRWMASPKEGSAAKLAVGGGKEPVVYTLGGITSHSVTIAQTQDGDGQVTLTLTACHVAVGGVAVN